MKRTLFLAAMMVATIGAVFVWSGGSPDTSYADEDEKLQELIQKMEEAVNKSGPEQSDMKGEPVEDDPTRSQASPVLPMAINGNPYDCRGRTDDPHLSENGVDASVHATSYCPGNQRVPVLGVRVVLYRWSCDGGCSWQVHGPPRQRVRFGVYSVTTNTRGTCVDGSYKAIGGHWMYDFHGRYYSTVTQNMESVTC